MNIFIFITQKVKPNLQVFEKQREITIKREDFLRNTEISMHFHKKKFQDCLHSAKFIIKMSKLR